MIIREFGVRHAQKAWARPVRQACRRALSTEPTQTAVPDVTDPRLGTPNAQPPSIFTSNAKTVSNRRKKQSEPDTTAQTFRQGWAMRTKLQPLGSTVQQAYRPGDLFKNPPGPKDVTLELLMASQCHMGHHTSLWNPANARYLYGIREGIHIISLEQIAAHLRRAARLVEEVAYHGGLILFVGTRPGQMKLVTQAARLAGACHLFTKWTPGSITNSDVILAGMQQKMLDENDQPLQGFDRHLNERRPLVPDLVVCFNPMENYTLLHECSLANVPTVGIIDTNAEPTWVTYAIPANDDSLRGVTVIASVLGRAGEAGNKRRLADATQGVVQWQTPFDVTKFLDNEREASKDSESGDKKGAGDAPDKLEFN